MVRLLAITLGLLATATVIWVWVYGLGTDCFSLYPNAPEGTVAHDEGGLWPPGTKCGYELPNGREETRSSFP